MKSAAWLPILLGSLLFLSACASRKPYYQDAMSASPARMPTEPESHYTLWLAGGVSLQHESAVRRVIDGSGGKDHGLVLLGDVVQADQLSLDSDEELSRSDPAWHSLTTWDDDYRDLFLIPGEKEWTVGRSRSIQNIKALNKITKDVKNKGRLIAPEKGCGTPEVVRLADGLILVLIDSQWALESERRGWQRDDGCDVTNLLELRIAFKDIVKSHATDFILVAAHHPVYANGPTAGNYPLSSHLLPLPVLGSLITGVKMLAGSEHRFGHPAFEAYRSALQTGLDGCRNCIVVSGHEKSLQAYMESEVYYLLAGSGREVAHARTGEGALFSYMHEGLARIDLLTSGDLQLSLVVPGADGVAAPVWTAVMTHSRDLEARQDPLPEIGDMPDSIEVVASDQYARRKFLRGEFYRRAWSAPVRVPVLWLDSLHGGLTPVQLGGGNQTRSLRLEDPEGHQYVLRSIDKKVTSFLPPALRGTFAENIVQDGIASSHPYGALVIPPLARAAGIPTSHPSVVYVPPQDALGIYNTDIGNRVFLFEERAGGNMSGFADFDGADESVSTEDLLEYIAESPRHVVDQQAVLRARLFDIWIGDWDRHDDQWRWAVHEEEDRTLYRPIPRDRDQVFFKNDGVLDYIVSRPFFNPALRRFGPRIDHLPGLVWAAKYFDRSFLHQLTEADFIAEARRLQERLTDEVIDRAFDEWPEVIDSLDGAEIRAALRQRRADLEEYAVRFYRHLSRVVMLPATNDKDVVHMDAPDDDRLIITIDRVTGKGKSYRFYERTFDDSVTREIRLFGLAKSDTFLLTGTGQPSIRLRLVGGTGSDEVINLSARLRPVTFDHPDGLSLTGGGAALRLNTDPANNSFDRSDWNLDRHLHFPAPAFFTDEGLGLSYQWLSVRHGFRADPDKSRHQLRASYFLGPASFIIRYAGTWRHAVGKLDAGLDAYVTGPTFTQYFYGLGNAYVNYEERPRYHIVKGSRIDLMPSLSFTASPGHTLFVQPGYQYMDIQDAHEKPRFIYTPESRLMPGDFGRRQYGSLSVGYRLDRLDHAGLPVRGGAMSISAGARVPLQRAGESNRWVSAEGSLFIPFDAAGTVVLATHVGADKLFGDYDFFHALTLGGPERVRGYRRDRFAGDARFYHATDLRVVLTTGSESIPVTMGVYGSFDYGRVWYKQEEVPADALHTAVGGGLFVAPFGLTAFRLGVMFGRQDTQINLGGAMTF